VLGPLDRDAIVQLTEDILDVRPGPSLMQLVEQVGGSPFLLVETLRGLREEDLLRVEHGQAVTTADRLPARVRDDMHERLDAVTPEARRVARAAAVLGRSVRFDQLATMLDAPPISLVEPVEELVLREVLADAGGLLQFRHDLIREAIVAGIPAVAVQAVRRQAAQVLLQSGVRPVELAARFASSSQPGDEVAISTLTDAARALSATDPGAAGDLIRQVVDLVPEQDDRRPALIAEAAVLLHAAGRDREARDVANTAIRRLLPPEAEAQVRLSIAQMFSLPADLRVGEGRAALALPGVSSRLRVRHLAVMVLSLTAASRVPEAQAAAVEAQAALDAADDPGARLSLEFGRLALDEATLDFAAVPARIATIRRLGTEAGDAAPVQAADWFRSSVLAHLDRFDEALRVAEDGLTAAQRDQQAWIAPRWDIWRGWILLQQGRLSDAGAALEGAFTSEGLDVATALPDAAGLAALGLVAIHTDDARLSRKCAQIARATLAVGADDEATRQVVWLLALLAMARGDAMAARRELLDGRGGDGTSLLPVLSRDVSSEVRLARLGLAAGDDELVDLAVGEADRRARRNADAAGIQGVAAHVRGLRRGDPEQLRAAVGLLTQSGRELALGSALEDLGRSIGPRDAVPVLERAAELYARIGAVRDGARVAGRLRGLGVERVPPASSSGWAALSTSEAVVARLIADGLTNRRVAEQMHISPHTVNTFLRRVFGKLDIHSRAELAGIVARHG
jgi:DNA-binding CsgD family transcriptional regulator